MAVHPRRHHDIATLLAHLASDDALVRESAAARLVILGRPAVTALAALVAEPSGPPDARAAALHCLAAIGAPQARAAAFAHVSDDADPLSLEAIAVLGVVAHGKDPESTRALDELTAVVVSPSVPLHRRAAALRALDGLDPSLLAPIQDALAADATWNPTASGSGDQQGSTLTAVVAQANLPAPSLMATIIREQGPDASLTDLHKLVGLIRSREDQVVDEERHAWMALRGLVHDTLAARGSRVAFHDVRETLEQCRGPLPVGFLSAAARVGPLDCLDAVAAAWTRHERDTWFCGQLADVFRAVAEREGLTRHHAAARRLVARWPAAVDLLAAVSRDTRRVSTTSRTRV